MEILDRRLEWVQWNRTHRDRAHRVGSIMERLVRRETAMVGNAGDVVDVIHAVVDAAFRNHCRVTVQAGPSVVIQVDHPVRLYGVRSRWLGPIRRALTLAGAQRHAERIVFEVGAATGNSNSAGSGCAPL